MKREAWIALLALALTGGLWALGWIDPTQAAEAALWIAALALGGVALRDGLRQVLGAWQRHSDRVAEEERRDERR
jgi:hypothetical protein